jgi:hypothetical protein
MNLTNSQRLHQFSGTLWNRLQGRSPNIYTLVIFAALLAFEIFNFSTTEFALLDMLGKTGMAGMTWATILALAFCAMDVAGIARLLSGYRDESQGDRGGWYLLGAWVLAASMNAGLTWWGISVAIYNQPADSILILDPLTFVTAIPTLVSFGIWAIRVLIIGSLVFSQKSSRGSDTRPTPARKPLGFSSARQAMPSGYQPLSTQAIRKDRPFGQ